MNLFNIARTYCCAPEEPVVPTTGAPPAAAAPAAPVVAAPPPVAAPPAAAAAPAPKASALVAPKDAPKVDDKTAVTDPAKADKGAADAELKIDLPDGVKVDEARLADFTKFAKEAGLSSEQASKAVAKYVEMQAAEAKAWEANDAKWGEQLKSDKDFGGAHLADSSAHAQKAVLKFGGRELADGLESLGLGNYPPLARAFAKIGKAMGEDSAAVALETPAPKPGDAKTRFGTMYDSPDSKKARGSNP